MILALVFNLILSARAEEKTCVVKGMVCQNCVDMVTKNVCNESFSTCRVRILDKKTQRGEIALVTKDSAATIDFKRIDAELDKLTYKIESCRAGVPKARP